MKSSWAEIRNFFSSKEIGYVFTRKELILALPSEYAPTIDYVRRWLVEAKFVEHVGRGKYQLVREIPKGMTTTEVLLLIKGDTLQYLEKVSARKERQDKRKNKI